MSADPGSGWKASLACTASEAQALAEDITPFASIDDPPVLVTSEIGPEDHWRLDAYFDSRPSRDMLKALSSLVPSAGGRLPELDRVEPRDWVAVSREGLDPVEAGRFFVHAPAHRDRVPVGRVAIEIDAGRAFGTGRHETTAGCLEMLDRMKRQGEVFSDIADIGTGTGLLAFAAHRLWPAARVIASDVDPIAIEVAAHNAAVNGVPTGRARGQVEIVTAAGMGHRRLRARAPFDLIIANILAAPLVDLAPSLSLALAPGGRIVLAGLLDHQAERVTCAYRRQRLVPAGRVDRDGWPTLLLRKRG